MKKQMLKFIKENQKSIKVFLFLFLLGLASGVLCFKYINIASNNTFIESFNQTLDLALNENTENITIIENGIKNTITMYFILISTSLILIAPILLFLIYLLKGFAVGILMSVLLNILGFNEGLLAILVLVILPNLLYIPALVFLGIKTVEFNYFILDKMNMKTKFKQTIVYAMYFIMATPIIFLSILIENIMFDVVLKLV